MKLPIDLRRPLRRVALLCAATVAAGLALPVYSTASQRGLRAEERAARVEERAARAAERTRERSTRERERAGRAQERLARRRAHREEREARRAARRAGRKIPGETIPGETDDGTNAENQAPSSPEPGAQPSGSTRGCRISIQTSSEHITAGEGVTVSGALQCPAGAEAAGRQIAVYQYQRHAGSGPDSASVLGIATTQTDGSYQLTSAALYTNTVFKAHLGRHGARAIVKVAPLITLSIPAPSEVQPSRTSQWSRSHARTRTTFTGTVSPAAPGARVVLQVTHGKSGERWRPVAFGYVGTDGGYSITHAFRIQGEATVRAIVHPDKHNAVGISAVGSYEVAQPQNPKLTIQISADPVSYGQPVTISGVASAGNQPVVLLARTNRGAFVTVATTTTDTSGHYAFTREPLQNTSYEVTDGTIPSTTLFEGVRFGLIPAATPSIAQAGQQLNFSGVLTGAPAGQVVYLERGYASGLGFHVVAAGTVDAASHFQIAYTLDHAGANVMRIRAPGDKQHRQSASAPFTITVQR